MVNLWFLLQVVDEALQGAVSSSAGLLLLTGTRVVLRHDIEQYKADHVVVLSGGGRSTPILATTTVDNSCCYRLRP